MTEKILWKVRQIADWKSVTLHRFSSQPISFCRWWLAGQPFGNQDWEHITTRCTRWLCVEAVLATVTPLAVCLVMLMQTEMKQFTLFMVTTDHFYILEWGREPYPSPSLPSLYRNRPRNSYATQFVKIPGVWIRYWVYAFTWRLYYICSNRVKGIY